MACLQCLFIHAVYLRDSDVISWSSTCTRSLFPTEETRTSTLLQWKFYEALTIEVHDIKEVKVKRIWRTLFCTSYLRLKRLRISWKGFGLPSSSMATASPSSMAESALTDPLTADTMSGSEPVMFSRRRE